MATNNQLNVSLSDSTGTVAFTGSTSPTIITPIIDQINDASAKTEMHFTTVASAVNNVIITDSITTVSPTIASEGSNSDIALTINSLGTGGVNIKGFGTNTASASGYVGEYASNTLDSGSATSLTDNTAKTITSFTLGAGIWDVYGAVCFLPAAGTSVTNLLVSFSTTDNALGTVGSTTGTGFSYATPAIIPGAVSYTFTAEPSVRNLSTSTTIYIVARARFTVSTMTAYGFIAARRVW